MLLVDFTEIMRALGYPRLISVSFHFRLLSDTEICNCMMWSDGKFQEAKF